MMIRHKPNTRLIIVYYRFENEAERRKDFFTRRYCDYEKERKTNEKYFILKNFYCLLKFQIASNALEKKQTTQF